MPLTPQQKYEQDLRQIDKAIFLCTEKIHILKKGRQDLIRKRVAEATTPKEKWLAMPPERRDEARKDVKKFMGIAPYNNWSNIVAGDGIFASSIRNRYGLSAEEIYDICFSSKRKKAKS
jgi:hypothetical protein